MISNFFQFKLICKAVFFLLVFFVSPKLFAENSNLNSACATHSKGVNAWMLFESEILKRGGVVPEELLEKYAKNINFDLNGIIINNGFNAIRFPVNPALYKIDANKKIIPEIISDIKKYNYRCIIIDVHPRFYKKNESPDGIIFAQKNKLPEYNNYIEFIRLILRNFDDSRFVLELLNEPGLDCSIHSVNIVHNFHLNVIKDLDNLSKNVTFLYNSSCNSSFRSLIKLNNNQIKELGDNFLFSFHYYEPLIFTHQGSFWSKRFPYLRHISRLPFDGSLDDIDFAIKSFKSKFFSGLISEEVFLPGSSVLDEYRREIYGERNIFDSFGLVKNWSIENEIDGRVVLGEFGVIRSGDDTGPGEKDRIKWLEAVRRAANFYGFGWYVWDYMSYMGISVSTGSIAISDDYISALGLVR